MRKIQAAMWYGEDRARLTYTGMMEMVAKASYYLSYWVKEKSPRVSFDVLMGDDPIETKYRRSNVYFHEDRAYIVRWRSLKTGRVSDLSMDFSHSMRDFAVQQTASKFPAQAKALVGTSHVVTTRDMSWNSAVPPNLRKPPVAPDGREVVGICLVFTDFVTWPDEMVERLQRGGVQFVVPNTQSDDDFDVAWEQLEPDSIEVLPAYYSAVEEVPGGAFSAPDGERLIHAITVKDPDNPESSFGVMGLSADSYEVVGLWLEDGEVDLRAVGSQAILEAMRDENDPFPFFRGHLDALLKIKSLAQRGGSSSRKASNIIKDIVARSTDRLIWPSKAEIRAMVPRVRSIWGV